MPPASIRLYNALFFYIIKWFIDLSFLKPLHLHRPSKYVEKKKSTIRHEKLARITEVVGHDKYVLTSQHHANFVDDFPITISTSCDSYLLILSIF